MCQDGDGPAPKGGSALRNMKAKSTVPRRGLLAGGNWIVDQVKMVDVYPLRDRLANILDKTAQGSGGAPYNVLVDLAKVGVEFPLWAAGLIGKDPFGAYILNDCQTHQVDTKYLAVTTEADTSYTDVMTERTDGHRTFFHYQGANALWTGKDLDFRKVPAKLFHLGYLLLLDGLDQEDFRFGTKAARLLSAARDAGLKTSVDVVSEDGDRFAKVVVPALKYVDYCILNEFEAGKITGFKVRQPDGKLDTVAARHAAGTLLQHGVKELIVIHFPEGAFARTRKGEDCFQSSVKLPEKWVAGTAGAGDAFCAGVLLGLHEGWELKKSLQTAVCMAAACLSHPTCTQGMTPLAECMALGQKYGYRAPLEKKMF